MLYDTWQSANYKYSNEYITCYNVILTISPTLTIVSVHHCIILTPSSHDRDVNLKNTTTKVVYISQVLCLLLWR